MIARMTEITPEQKQAAVAVVMAVAETIRELGSVPSGHLYAQVMHKIGISDYEAIIDTLKHARLVVEKNHELTWVGPKVH